MSIALFALAAVMIVGGIVSVIQGFPFVRLESGLAMTIAGATTASAGAVVLGLAVVARRLGGLARALDTAALVRPRADVGDTEAGGLETGNVDTGHLEPSSAAPARQRPSLAVGAGLGGLAGASLGTAATMRAGREPTFFDPAPPAQAASDAANPSEPLLPNLLPEDGAPTPGPAGRSEPVFSAPGGDPLAADLLFDAPEPKVPDGPHVPGTETPGGRAPAVAVVAEHEAPRPPEPAAEPQGPVETVDFTELPSPPEPAPEPHPIEEAPFVEAPPVDAEPQVVGTYASGGNTYVMYATGVIEAETPRGRYTFASLDELKAFVEAGGESDTRGAA